MTTNATFAQTYRGETILFLDGRYGIKGANATFFLYDTVTDACIAVDRLLDEDKALPTGKAKTATQIRRDTFASNPRLTIHLPEHRASWRRYGTGVANVEVITYRDGAVSIQVEETAFAGVTDKRDVTRAGWATIDRAAATALRDLLNEALAEQPAQSPQEPR